MSGRSVRRATAFDTHGQNPAMETVAVWRSFFERWPTGVPRSGVLVTTWDEQIPFEGFMHSDEFVLIERRTPDTIGARKIIVPYTAVAALKFTDVLSAQAFAPWGFAGQPGKKSSA